MKWFAIICVLAILGSGLALGPKCKGEDVSSASRDHSWCQLPYGSFQPKIFDGLSQIEIEVICGKDNDSEKKAKRQTLQEKCKKRDVSLRLLTLLRMKAQICSISCLFLAETLRKALVSRDRTSLPG